MKEALEHIQEHVELIARHEQEFLNRRSRSERVSDAVGAFAGSLTFVLLHSCFFVLWVLANTFQIGRIPHFDPAPFSLLATLVALEAILLASFILMRQSRLSRRDDERDHLILQVLLLTEKEITAVIGMTQQIAEKVGLHSVARDENIAALSEATPIDELAQTIKESLSPDKESPPSDKESPSPEET